MSELRVDDNECCGSEANERSGDANSKADRNETTEEIAEMLCI
jgi:hypothetical protein